MPRIYPRGIRQPRELINKGLVQQRERGSSGFLHRPLTAWKPERSQMGHALETEWIDAQELENVVAYLQTLY